MADQENSEQPAPSGTDNKRGWIARRVHDFKGRRQQRRTEKAHETAIDRATRGTKWATYIIAIATVVTAGAAISQYFVFNRQLTAMQGQLTEMRTAREGGDKATGDQLRVMQDQATAMQKQVDAMQVASAQTERAIAATNRLAEEARKTAAESQRLADAASQANVLAGRLGDAAIQGNAINRQALVNVQRAFVFSSGVQFRVNPELPTGAAAQWFADILLQNIGNTPTRDMKITTDCLVSKVPIPDAYKATAEQFSKDQMDQLFAHKTLSQKAVLGPKQQITGNSCSLNFVQIFFLQRAWIHYYVSGNIEYKDALDPAVTHLTEYCYELSGISAASGKTEKTGLGLDVPAIMGVAHLCEAHNCMDDECSKKDRETAAHDLRR